MPNYKHIAAGTKPAAPEPSASLDELLAAIAEAEVKVQSFRALRYNIRQSTPKPQILEALAESDADFNEALKALAALQKRYARAVKQGPEGPAQVVTIAPAHETAEAGGTNG